MNATSNLKSFFSGSVILVISNIFLKAINFFLLPLYTSNLTPQMLGISDSVTTLTGLIFPILVMGLDSAYSAFYFDEADVNRKSEVFCSITSALFVLGLVPVILCLFSNSISVFLFGNNEYSMVIVVSLISVSLNLWYLSYTLELRMQNKMLTYGIITVVSSLLMVTLNIYFVSVIQIGVYALSLSTMIVYGVQLVIFKIVVQTKVNRCFIKKKLLYSMFKFGLPLVPNVVAMWVLNLSDRYVILYFLGEMEVGLYGIGSRFATIVNVIISGIATAYTTFAYSNIKSKDAKKQYTLVLNIVYVLVIGIVFVVSVFSKEFVVLMAEQSYASAYQPMRDMMFAQAVYGISTIISYGIYFAKQTKYTLYSTVVAAIVNLALNIIFIPIYGIRAAATTTLVGYAVMLVINYINAQRLYPCPYEIRKVGFNILMLYVIALMIYEMNIVIKLLVTITVGILTLWTFRTSIIEGIKVLRTE